MMGYVWIIASAAVQTAFLYLFFGCFLGRKTLRAETGWFLGAAWLVTAVFGLLGVAGIYAYLVYLLVAVLLLLCVFGESGGRGLCLLGFATVIFLCCDWIPAGKLLALGCVLPVRYFRKNARVATPEEMDNLLLRQHMEMQQESMRALEQNYRMQRRSTHEFEHHMQVLRDLLERGEDTAARDYLERLKKNRSIHVMSVSSNHPVVDVILNQKYQTARENEIRMQVKVNDLSAVEVPTDSLVVVLTNLLDNAIEACRRVDGCREIFCSIVYDGGLYLSIRNTSKPVRIVDGRIPTSKQDDLRHGYGLESVSRTLDVLGAEYTFGYEDGWFRFSAEI